MLSTAPSTYDRCGSVTAILGSIASELTGIPTLRNIETPFRTSIKATSCGVVTITAPGKDECQYEMAECISCSLIHTFTLNELTETELHVTSARREIDDE